MMPQPLFTIGLRRRFVSALLAAAGILWAAGGPALAAEEPGQQPIEPAGLLAPALSGPWNVAMPSMIETTPASPTSASLSRQIQRPPVVAALYASVVALNTYDVVLTAQALNLGAVEMNPMLGSGRHAAWVATMKGATTFATVLIVERIWRRHHPRQAIAVMAIANGLMTGVAIHNASVVRRLR